MISVIMPVYNAEPYLKRSVFSVLNQSFKDFELILIDDGSTDHSLEICRSFNDPRVRVIHEKNSGASHARNTGIQEARGDRLCFIDCDDEYLPGYLEKMSAYEEDLVICRIHYEGEKKASGYDSSFHLSSNDYPSHMENMIKKGILNSPVTKLYRTSIIRDNTILFNESMKVGEDLNFNFKYLIHTENLFYLSEDLYLYHMNESMGTHRSYIPDVIDQRKINIALLENYFKENHLNDMLIRQLKVKLIYICVMQETELGKQPAEIWNQINIPYFHDIGNVSGAAYRLMLKTYQTGNINKICRLGKFLRKARRYTSSASV